MKVRTTNDNRFMLFCPACECGHWFNDTWQFNGDMEKPTISPSILVRSVTMPDPIPRNADGSYKIGADGRVEGSKDSVCHSFVTDGKIRFLDDCTHDMAGQIVDLLEF